MKKVYSVLILAGLLALTNCQTSKKEDPKPAPGGLTTSTKSTAATTATSTKKVSNSREKTSKTTTKVRNLMKSRREARLAMFRIESDSTHLPPFDPNTTTPGFDPNTSFPGFDPNTSTPGVGGPGNTSFPSDTTLFDFSKDFSMEDLSSLDAGLEAELGGKVSIEINTVTGNMGITIDYGVDGSDNPAYKTDKSLAKKLFGKLTMSIETGKDGKFKTKVSFVNYAEQYDNATLNSTMTGTFTDESTFATDGSFSSENEMDLTFTSGGSTTSIKGKSSVKSGAVNTLTGEADLTDNSTLTIKEGNEEFTYVSKDVVTKFSCNNGGLPVSGTATITAGSETITFDYGDGTCDTKAKVTTGGVTEELDLATLETQNL